MKITLKYRNQKHAGQDLQLRRVRPGGGGGGVVRQAGKTLATREYFSIT